MSKLYLVKCRGMKSSYGTAYVVADDPTMAYQILREYLDEQNLGFTDSREMDTVELLAGTGDDPPCGMRLFIPGSQL